MTGRVQPVRFDPQRHRTDEFSCGVPALDDWLRRYAGQGQRRDASRTFVVIDDLNRVVAYYTLLAGEVDHADASPEVRRRMSRHFPIPVCVLGRLAVDRRHQRAGIGTSLLADALDRACRAAEEIGMRAVVVHAVDDGAAGFYERFGFASLTDDPLTLMVTVAHVRAAQADVDADPADSAPTDESPHEREARQAFRAAWAEVFIGAGAQGLRPKLTPEALVVYRSDGSPVVARARDGDLPLHPFNATLVVGDREEGAAEMFFADPGALLEQLVAAARCPGARLPGGFVRWYPPTDEAARIELAAAYATYRIELDTLAVEGIHAYIERSAELRLYADIGSHLLIDVSIADAGLPAAPETDDGPWVGYISNEDGYEAEFTVDRAGDRESDAETLAGAVSDALASIIRDHPVFLERYDRRLGRLDPPR